MPSKNSVSEPVSKKSDFKKPISKKPRKKSPQENLYAALMSMFEVLNACILDPTLVSDIDLITITKYCLPDSVSSVKTSRNLSSLSEMKRRIIKIEEENDALAPEAQEKAREEIERRKSLVPVVPVVPVVLN